MTTPYGAPVRQQGCPECGRPVPPGGSKLCPHCGYPLLLDRAPAVEASPQKIVYKPEAPDVTYQGERPVMGGPPPPQRAPQYAPPQRAQVFGPRCSMCRSANPPQRKRCEVCGAELWPGAAFPPRTEPAPPPVISAPPRRRSWWKPALAIGLPILAIATVWALAWFL